MSRRTRYAVLAVLATTAVAGGILAGAAANPKSDGDSWDVAPSLPSRSKVGKSGATSLMEPDQATQL